MQPRRISEADLVLWSEHNPSHIRFTGDIATGVFDCQALLTIDPESKEPVVRVPWVLSADELALLQAGGQLWVSVLGDSLMATGMHVQPAIEAGV